MGEAKRRGTRDERMAQARAKLIEEFRNFPKQFFGFNRECRPDESPFDLSEDGLVCMVSELTALNLDDMKKSTNKDWEVGQWFCSTGAHENTVTHGPFESVEDAFDFAQSKFGSIRFVCMPEIDPDYQLCEDDDGMYYLGLKKLFEPREFSIHEVSAHLACQIKEVTEKNICELRYIKNDIAPGDWIIYVNSEEFDVLGPFKNMDDAFNFAKSNLGVVCFVDGNLEV